jgi:hypothetical protein
MATWEEKAFDFASEATKQLITLATAVVALTITFSKDVLDLTNGEGKVVLGWAWILYLASVIAGIVTLQALAGSLGTSKRGERAPSIYERNVTIPAIAQVACFGVGTLFTVFFVFIGLTTPA